ncbi:aldo/keto reductase [Spiroplasma chrysopicola]|uniref:Aldo/keto reductase n=1 Tax=Spiroplasma chrysopicola DF-1 TaxID=1276227 RepID=R4U209_9MOLU|nr:aldo/keto reductase [Spiroplasma chrysopicola]AGM25377.1 aldo/keto reductase [Spiroplasma chrysopicola DF-1]
MPEILTKKITLNNGVAMPIIGYGTYLVTDQAKGLAAITHAINYGYQLIDTADIYHNHALVREAILNSNQPRENLFITTKIWITNKTPEIVKADMDRILKELGTDYLDLVLVHWPLPDGIMIYQTLEEIYQTGKIRAIGVSNFMIDQLKNLLEQTTIVPVVNQVELHPQLPLLELQEFCQKHNIVLESWQTIMKGKVGDLPYLQTLAAKYNVDAPAIALKWAIQRGIIVIPKSETLTRIESNVQKLAQFELLAKEIEAINDLEPILRLGPDPYHFVG